MREADRWEEAKREALWGFVRARLDQVMAQLDLPLEAVEALEAGYLAALEDFAPGVFQLLGEAEEAERGLRKPTDLAKAKPD
ncbi:hypothetical protein Theos_1688 [Thermus oshimai JL-2]|uniref:Uncharacterized protein n=1 Tax=Thermus oshimai JL-2 TaxID=751945 RepID=K7RJZ5_THEOS|nr:hypothetical protein [Thermus oshimai]AFV76712.1 hypothetical protein Theos_1688 [Thermus oshimai JL-2]